MVIYIGLPYYSSLFQCAVLFPIGNVIYSHDHRGKIETPGVMKDVQQSWIPEQI